MAPRVEPHNFQNAYAFNACFLASLDDRHDALRESPPKLCEIQINVNIMTSHGDVHLLGNELSLTR